MLLLLGNFRQISTWKNMISTSDFILFQFSSIALKVAISHKEDLAKSGYKTNWEVENLGILYYLFGGESLEPII